MQDATSATAIPHRMTLKSRLWKPGTGELTMNLYAIARPVKGATANSRKYLCNDKDEVMMFYAEVEALLYLHTQNIKKADMEREGIEIIEMQDCGNHYEPIREGDTED